MKKSLIINALYDSEKVADLVDDYNDNNDGEQIMISNLDKIEALLNELGANETQLQLIENLRESIFEHSIDVHHHTYQAGLLEASKRITAVLDQEAEKIIESKLEAHICKLKRLGKYRGE